VAAAEHLLDLPAQALHMGTRGLGVEAEAGTATLTAATRVVIAEQQQDLPPLAHLPQHPGGQHFAEMRPAEIEAAAKIAERLDQADRRARGVGEVEASIHALHGRQGGRMQGAVAFALQHRLGAAETLRMLLGSLEQPVDALGNGQSVGRIGRDRCDLGVDGHRRPPP
jgi:hypothetical protein